MVLPPPVCHKNRVDKNRKWHVIYMDWVMHPGVKLRHIRLFLQIADSVTLSAAAQVLGLSQPALSKSLAELEVMIGAPLFLRQGRKLILTATGEQVRRHAREALASLDAAARAAQAVTAHQTVGVGLLPTVSTRFFPAVISRYMADGGGATLAVETGSHPFLLRKLRDRQIDLMIGRMPNAAEMDGLEFEWLYDEAVVAVVRADHPQRRAGMAEVLRASPLVLPPHEAIIRKNVDEYLAALGFSGLRPAVETSTLALGRGIVLASDAVWFISVGVVQNELDAGQLAMIPLGATYLSGAVGMTWLRAAALSEPVLDLIRFARERAGAGAGVVPAQSSGQGMGLNLG